MSDASRPSPAVQAATWHDAEDLRWAARHWATRIGVQLRQVHVRPMTTKWASMSTAGRLTLNSELLDLPRVRRRIRHRARAGAPARAESRQGVQELHGRVPAGLGGAGEDAGHRMQANLAIQRRIACAHDLKFISEWVAHEGIAVLLPDRLTEVLKASCRPARSSGRAAL